MKNINDLTVGKIRNLKLKLERKIKKVVEKTLDDWKESKYGNLAIEDVSVEANPEKSKGGGYFYSPRIEINFSGLWFWLHGADEECDGISFVGKMKNLKLKQERKIKRVVEKTLDDWRESKYGNLAIEGVSVEANPRQSKRGYFYLYSPRVEVKFSDLWGYEIEDEEDFHFDNLEPGVARDEVEEDIPF